MSRTVAPRAVVIARPSEYQGLLLRHGTREQARFFLASRGRTLDEAFAHHELQQSALHAVGAQIPMSWRRATVDRADLDRFLFDPEDVVIAVGQDGLVANVAKYLTGQVVIGVNPAPSLFEGVLARHPPQAVADLLSMAARGALPLEERAMVRASTADGSSLLALNEIFLGHRSHQSARYVLSLGQESERHSSSGLIVCTGTGASGWARSVALRRDGCPPLPTPTSPALAFLVREAWPSVVSGTKLVHGVLEAGAQLIVTSEMNDGGTAFGDGIEDDHLDLPWGQVTTIALADQALRLAA